jgi:uncharacterized membrane protein (DUF4010 family)
LNRSTLDVRPSLKVMSMHDTQLWPALLVAALCGAAVGTERQWSGHAEGEDAHFGGLRTFTLLGLLGSIAGWLWINDGQVPAALLLGAAAALVVTAYAAASLRDIDGTTEVAALVVIAAGLLTGVGQPSIASGITAGAVLLLAEKRRLHGLVRLMSDNGFRAGARFAVMAAVILPLLPEGPYPGLADFRPRRLWLLVLLFSGLSFAGYIARSLAGDRRGLPLTGLIGGIVSSTSVTLTFARLSRVPSTADGTGLAAGTLAACTILFPRVFVAATALAPALAPELWMLLLPPFVACGTATLLAVGRQRFSPAAAPLPVNPLQLRAALQMAVLFQVVSMLVTYAYRSFGDRGLVVSAVLTGLTDVDALTASMAFQARGSLAPTLAAGAIAAGIAANTLLKSGIALVVGRGAFRRRTVAALAITALVALARLVLCAS